MKPVLVELDSKNVDTLPCCGITNAAHEGRCNKGRWLKAQLKNGLRAKVLLTPDGKQCGYVECIPGEYAWRGVDAAGYMFIHCIFTYRKEYQHQGLGARMIEACVDDARKAGMRGVAVMVREGPWMAGPELFLANGFEVVDSAPPDYQLLVKKLERSAPNPAFPKGWEERLAKYKRGLTMIVSDQCPHIAKFAGEIAESAERDYATKLRVVTLKSCRDAQNAPTPYAVFALLHNGRVLADHPVSLTRFHNIMKKLK